MKTTNTNAQDLKISISHNNKKLIDIPSVSLPPIITCRRKAPCIHNCYACRMQRYASVKNAWQRNYQIYLNAPDLYFEQLTIAFKMNKYFRLHVSGDIPTADYFIRLCKAARAAKDCKILCFTKQYEIVNNYLDNGGKIPHNLQLVFSGWGAWQPENPHRLPTAQVIFKGEKPADDWKICGGNCSACACRGVGCWTLKNGETIAFAQH